MTLTATTATRTHPADADHAELLCRLRNGDRTAFAELVRRFTPLVEAAARRCGARPGDVDDVAQDVWIALLRRSDTIASPACLPGWLRRVTANAASATARRRRAVEMAELPERCDDLSDDATVRGLVREDRCRAVRAALARLSSADRTLMELLMAEDRPDYRAVGERVRRPVGSIGPTRGRLLRRLGSDPDIVRVAVA